MESRTPRLEKLFQFRQLSRALAGTVCLALLATSSQAQTGAAKPPAEVLRLVEEAIQQTSERHMDFQVNTPWQILHGLLALRENYVLKNGDQMVNALHHMSNGARYKGKLWFEATAHGGRAHPYNGTPYDFEGHINQSLAIIAMCNPPLTHTFLVEGGKTVTMADMIKHSQMTTNSKEETTWTLWFLTHYLDQDTQWVNAQGQRWSMESLVRIQVAASPIGAPCGGTHSLFALAYARNSYLQKHGELRGAWLEADQKLQRYIAAAQAMQNRDGSFATQFFKARGFSNDFNERIKSSGHMLEWLMMALPRKRLDEAWVARGVERLAQDLLDNANKEAECGPLYHSLHALILYRQRVAPDLSPPVPAELAANGNARPLHQGPVVSIRPDNSATPENVENLSEIPSLPVAVPGADVAMTVKPEPMTSAEIAVKPETSTVPGATSVPVATVPNPKTEVVIESNRPIRPETNSTRTANAPTTAKTPEPAMIVEPRQPLTNVPIPSATTPATSQPGTAGEHPQDLPATSPQWMESLVALVPRDATHTATPQGTSQPIATGDHPQDLPVTSPRWLESPRASIQGDSGPPTVPMPSTTDATTETTGEGARPVTAPPALMPILKRPRVEVGEQPEDLVPKVRPINDESPAPESYEFSDDQFLVPPVAGG